MTPSKKTFVALDNLSLEQVREILPTLKGKVAGIKIGLEMYLSHGKDFVIEAKKTFGGKIFLDLKLHDIPNTVSKAILGLKGLPVDFLTIHAAGGQAMIEAAYTTAKHSLPGVTVLAVTVLTSLDDQDSFEIFASDRSTSFDRLLEIIEKVPGVGLVCSAAELSLLKNKSMITMVPGIRFASEIAADVLHDQKNVFTPKQAIELGAKFIVIGRSITQAPDLDLALAQID